MFHREKSGWGEILKNNGRRAFCQRTFYNQKTGYKACVFTLQIHKICRLFGASAALTSLWVKEQNLL